MPLARWLWLLLCLTSCGERVSLLRNPGTVTEYLTFCQQKARLTCASWARCGFLAPAQEPDCPAFFEEECAPAATLASLARGSLLFDRDYQQACLQAQEQLACLGERPPPLPDPCALVLVGATGAGGPCLSAVDCKDGLGCDPLAGCGRVCSRGRTPGQPCGPATPCDPSQAYCASGSCVALRADGEGCQASLECLPGSHCAPGRTCQPRQAQGGACQIHEGCQAGLQCQGGSCQPRPAEGAACVPSGGNPCQAGRVCLAQQQVCAPLERLVGESCAPEQRCIFSYCREGTCSALTPLGGGCATSRCVFGTVCEAARQVCVPAAAEGERCQGCGSCLAFLGCLEGQCRPLGGEGAPCGPGCIPAVSCRPGFRCQQGRCTALLPAGAACGEGAACGAGRCEGGTCCGW